MAALEKAADTAEVHDVADPVGVLAAMRRARSDDGAAGVAR